MWPFMVVTNGNKPSLAFEAVTEMKKNVLPMH